MVLFKVLGYCKFKDIDGQALRVSLRKNYRADIKLKALLFIRVIVRRGVCVYAIHFI